MKDCPSINLEVSLTYIARPVTVLLSLSIMYVLYIYILFKIIDPMTHGMVETTRDKNVKFRKLFFRGAMRSDVFSKLKDRKKKIKKRK